MLYRLIGGERASEHLTLHRIIPRHIETGFSPAHGLESRLNCGAVKQGVDQSLAPGDGQKLGRRAFEIQPIMGAQLVRAVELGLLDARVRQIDHRKGEVAARAAQDHGERGYARIGDRGFETVQGSIDPFGVDRSPTPTASALGIGEGSNGLAGSQARQPLFFLRLGPRQANGVCGEHDRGKERRSRIGPAQGLGHHAEVKLGQPHPAKFFGDIGAQDAQRRKLAPQGSIPLFPCINQLAQAVIAGMFAQQVSRLLGQHLLFVGKVEIHFARGLASSL